MPVLLGSAYVNRFVVHIFPPERKIFPYNFKPVPILSIKDMPEEHKHKIRDVTIMEEDTQRLLPV